MRKFFCRNAGCIRRIFAEQLIGLADKYSRKTFRLTEALLKLSMITSAEAASKIAATIAYGTSPNTLLRLIKDYEVNSYVDMEKVQHIGIDDWAFKKKKTYGTLICDLVTQRPIDILPDRDANTLSKWLKKHPHITLVSRDRSNVYARAISSTLPHATQVVDRWHLVKNVYDALIRWINAKYPNGLKIEEESKDENASCDNRHKTKYEIKREEAYEKKKQNIIKAKDLFAQGYNKTQISKIMSLDRGTVKKYVEMEEIILQNRRMKNNIAIPYMATIKKLLAERVKVKTIYHSIVNEGYTGSERFLRYIITHHCGNKKKHHVPIVSRLGKVNLSMLLWKKEDDFTEVQKKLLKEYINPNQKLMHIRDLTQQFRTALDAKEPLLLSKWLHRIEEEKDECYFEVAVLMKTDIKEINNALIYRYSNGLLEGNINRLKTIKRQMYGRAKFDLLRKKVLYRLD